MSTNNPTLSLSYSSKNLQYSYFIRYIQIMNKYIVGGIGLGVASLTGFLIKIAVQKSQANKAALAQRLFVGIELGGTNYNVAIAEPILNNNGEILDFRITKRKNGITYTNPEESIKQIVQFILASQQSHINHGEPTVLLPIYFIGIASFGPLCLDHSSPDFGTITTTPKQLWRNKNVLKAVMQYFNTPIKTGIDTDVNAAAFAEFKLGQHPVKESLAYITVGTGVGVGIIANGKTVHGLTHPEGGHIIAERHPEEYEHFYGVCPFHKDRTCIEAMVCNKSIAERLQVDFTALADISDDSKVWKLVGFYLAQLCLNITLLLSPEVIVIGGGIMNRKILYNIVREEFIRMLAKYVQHPLLSKQQIDRYIIAPNLGSDVGVKGAMALSFL